MLFLFVLSQGKDGLDGVSGKPGEKVSLSASCRVRPEHRSEQILKSLLWMAEGETVFWYTAVNLIIRLCPKLKMFFTQGRFEKSKSNGGNMWTM